MYLPHWGTPRLHSPPGCMSRAETNSRYLLKYQTSHLAKEAMGEGGGRTLSPEGHSACQSPFCKASAGEASSGQLRGPESCHGEEAVPRGWRRASWCYRPGVDKLRPAGCVLWPASYECFFTFLKGCKKKKKKKKRTMGQSVCGPESLKYLLPMLSGSFHKMLAGPCSRKSISKQPSGAHRGSRDPGGTAGFFILSRFSDLEHRRASCHHTRGCFCTLSSSCGARTSYFCARMPPEKADEEKGEAGGSACTPLGGASPGSASLPRTSGVLRAWSPSLSAKPEGMCSLMVESVLCDFCAHVYNLCKPPGTPNQSGE
nr:uncharacterized protein LOC123845900 [Mirounga angustirostris]